MVYTAALWMIGEFGDGTKQWILAYPDTAIAAAVSIVILAVILKLTFSSSQYSYAIKSATLPAAMRAGHGHQKPSNRDNQYTAAHETGHALTYAALGSLPPGIELVIRENYSIDHSLGYISGINSKHQLNEKTFCEWLMLVFLAGKMGEWFALGEHTLGSANDHQKWLNVARTYLANYFDGIYYCDPQNEIEQKLNEDKLNSLKAKQEQILEALFQTNGTIFNNLKDALLEKKSMNRDDMHPFLSQVVLPKEFPKPFGEIETFSKEWPVSSGLYTDNDDKILR